jgi:hypothetical protein
MNLTISKTPSQHKLKQIKILEQKVRACQFVNPRLAQAYKKELEKLKETIGV